MATKILSSLSRRSQTSDFLIRPRCPTLAHGARLGPPWDAADWGIDPDWDFNSAADDTPEQLYALWDETAVGATRSTWPCS